MCYNEFGIIHNWSLYMTIKTVRNLYFPFFVIASFGSSFLIIQWVLQSGDGIGRYLSMAQTAQTIETMQSSVTHLVQLLEEEHSTAINTSDSKLPESSIGLWYKSLQAIGAELYSFPKNASEAELQNFIGRMHRALQQKPKVIECYPHCLGYRIWQVSVSILLFIFLYIELEYAKYKDDHGYGD